MSMIDRRSLLQLSAAAAGTLGLGTLGASLAHATVPQFGGTIPGFGPLVPTAAQNTGEVPWGQDAALRQWIRHCRLDAFGRLAGAADKADVEKQAVLARLKTQAQAAAANMPRLLAATAAG